jgi:acetyl esterase/lipase
LAGWSKAAVVPFLALLVCLAAAKHSPATHRLQESELEAVKQARLEWSKIRVVRPLLGPYEDFRAILHVHAEDAPHTLGTREQVLTAAREAGVSVIMWSDHRGPLPETWSGSRKGVLFIPGAEEDHKLRYPGPDGDLQFLSHPEEVPNSSTDGLAGMEIYNRHTDANLHTDLNEYVQRAMEDSGEWRRLSSRQSRYPLEVYAAGTDALDSFVTRYDQEIAKHRFTAIAANDAHRNTVLKGVVFDTYEVAFKFVSTHILSRELKEDQIRQSLREGHAYVAFDWLCDPAGFSFVARSILGVYDMGDRVPMIPNTRLEARLPIKAHLKLLQKGKIVSEATSTEMTYTPTEEGAYRLEAWLPVAGEERIWIYSNPLYLYKPDPSELALPPSTLEPNVKSVKGIEYTPGNPTDAAKHKLDLYLPTNRTKFPVLFFVHGGSWRSGDRSQYPSLGNRFAKLGIGVVIPSYRLAPANPHPAQVEDVAAAFAWTVKHIAEYGGDPGQLYAAGHSAGGHMVSLLALDPRYLEKHGLTAKAMRGVIASSGVYDVRTLPVFGATEDARWSASPLKYVHREVPPFLITYCQWDYPGLPAQAREFDRALRHAFVESTLAFVPGENHISEMAHLWKDSDPTAREILKFVEAARQ